LKRTVTLQHIADRLHLSRTTISLALSDHPRIGQTTKDKVRALARRMGYEPDRIARSLATGRSSLIGVMVPDSTNAYYAEVIRGIEEAARIAQLGVVLANGSYDLELEAARIREMAQVRVARVIAAPAFNSEKPKLKGAWHDLRQSNLPLVLVNRQLNPPIFHQVSADNVDGMRLAVEAIASLGHRRVAYLRGIHMTVPTRQRLRAFHHFARKHQFDEDPNLIDYSDIGPRAGYEACKRLWSKLRKKPTAILTLSDAEALGVLRYLHELNVHVPQDVSVMGFDGFEVSEFSQVSLSTIETPMHEIGKRAVEILTDTIKNPSPCPQNVVLPVRLRLRESVGRASRSG
jgi:DNA-binding LacI/PurR family transcriptional regulator